MCNFAAVKQENKESNEEFEQYPDFDSTA